MEVDYWEDFNEYIEEIKPKVTFVKTQKYKGLIEKLKEEDAKKIRVIQLNSNIS